MELARILVLEIATVSQRVVSAATQYARRRGFKNVQSCHFRLEKQMQTISVAAGGILDVLSKSSLSNGTQLDDRLQDWFSSDELPTCLDTLHQMERMLLDDTWTNMVFNFVNTLRALPPEDEIDAAVKLFDSRRKYFHFLLTTDVWNCEDSQQQQPARSVLVQEGRASDPVPELNTGSAVAVDQDTFASVPLSAESTAILSEEKDTKQADALRKLDEILKWLDGLSCVAKQEETLSLRQPDTCTWLHSTPEYKSWRNSNSDDSFLWLQGKPGSGKTVLASFVITSLKEKRGDGETLAYFYCDFRNDRSTSAAEVMRSLLSQLLRHVRNGKIDPGQLVDDLVREKNGDTPILNNVKRLATFVSQTAKQFSHQPLVVVDALDECKDVEKLLDGVFTLAEGSIRLFVTSRPLQVIKDDLRDLPFVSMDKMTSAVSADIALHVARELDSRRRLRDLEPGFKKEIHVILCCKADGMFRWVQCQIDTLNQCATVTEVRKALNNLPIGLDETYERILTAIDLGSPDGKLALRALVWLVGALRPLRLAEILEGLTIDPARRTMDPEAGAMHKGVLLHACGSLVTYNEKTDIIILSHFSVKEYLTGDPTQKKLLRYHVNYQRAHERLARTCICYATLYLKYIHESSENNSHLRIMRIMNGQSYCTSNKRSHLSDNSSAGFSTSQELLGYVFTDGFNHLAYLGRANHAVLKDMAILQSDIQRYPAAWEQIRRKSQSHRLPVPWPACEHDFMLYVLTAFGSDSLLRAYLGPARRILKPRYRTNPLVYAAHFGKPQHARLMLSRGAQVNERGLAVEGPHQPLPLEVAVSRQQEAMVDLLLSTGSVVPKQLFARTTDHNFPIRIARRLLQTDEFVEWAAEPGNKPPSPLGLLARRLPLVYERDIIVMIRRLVQVGLNPAACNSARQTALHLAVIGGYQTVMVYLLLIGVPFPVDFLSTTSRIAPSEQTLLVRALAVTGTDVCISGTGDTSMHLVIRDLEEKECLEAVKTLVCAGCKPLVPNQARVTPLYLALEKRYSSVANYLWSQGTPLDTLLAVAENSLVAAWRVNALRALVRGGAGIRGTRLSEYTQLHQEMTLLEKFQGLEMTKPRGAGFTPAIVDKTYVDLAMDLGRSLADYLLSAAKPFTPDALFYILHSSLPAVCITQTICSLVGKRTDIHGHGTDGNTLLHAALLALDERQGLDVAGHLVGAGCDPSLCNSDGETPLHIALRRRSSLIADYLLSATVSLPPDVLFSVLRSELPDDWTAQTICSLIRRGADVRGIAADETPFLHAAVLALDERHGLAVVQELIGAGCDPFQCNAYGETLLHIALDRGFSLIVDYLLSTGKPLPPDALFAILRSSLPGAWKAQRIFSLVRGGADVRGLSADENTLLHVALHILDSEHSNLAVVRELTGAGCDPFQCNAHGKTPFRIALDRKFSLIAETLLSTERPFPPSVMFAILYSELPAVWRARTICSLVAKGVDVCGLSAGGTPFSHAAVLALDEHQALTVVQHLVRAGCDPFRYSADGKTLLHIALHRKFSLIADHLLPAWKPIPLDALFAVLQSELPDDWRTQTIRSLVEKKADVCGISADGNTLLHAALLSLDERRGLDVGQLLIDAGCDPFQVGADGKTPLHIALDRRFSLTADYLLSTGKPFPLDALFAVLHSALPSVCRAQMICSLVEKGADVCRLSPDGNTLLHAAIFTFPERHALAVARLLIGAGCNPAVYNRHRRTALHIAVQKGYVSVLKYILTLDQSLPDDILFTVLKSRHRSQVPILRALISKGANTRGVVDGKNLLHVVIPLLPYDWLKVLNIRVIVKTIVDSGCDTLAPNSRGETPLHLAVAAGYISLVMYLMSITTPPSLPTDILACALGEGPVPTRYSWKNTYQILRLLIDKGANTHVRAADGGTLLHMAIKNYPRLRKLPTTPRILPIPLPPSRPLSPLPLKLSSLEWNDSMDSDASEGENLLLLELEGLEEHDLLDIIRLLVDSGRNPTRCDADGNPPIHFAEVRGHFDVLEYLLPLTVDKPWQNLQDTTDSTPRSVCGEVKEELATSTC